MDAIERKPQPKFRRFEGKTELEALASLRDWCNRHKVQMPTPADYKETFLSGKVWVDVPEEWGK